MLIVMLFAIIFTCVGAINLLAYLPLHLLQSLQPSTWVALSLLFLVFAWCLGEDR